MPIPCEGYDPAAIKGGNLIFKFKLMQTKGIDQWEKRWLKAGNCCVIWKDLWWRADSYRFLKYRGGCTIPSFEFSVWCEKCVAARHYADIWKQLLILNYRNRVRWLVLGLPQDGVCTDSFENFSVKSLKRDQSNDTKFNPPLFPLVNTFKIQHCEVNTTHLLNDGMVVLRVGQVLEGLEGGPLGGLVALLDHVEVFAGAEHGGRVLLQKARDLVQPETAVSVRVKTQISITCRCWARWPRTSAKSTGSSPAWNSSVS